MPRRSSSSSSASGPQQPASAVPTVPILYLPGLPDQELAEALHQLPLVRAPVAMELLDRGRFEPVLQAVEAGVMEPGLVLDGENRIKLVHIAAAKGAVPLLRALVLAHHVDADEPAVHGYRPLHAATKHRRVEASLFLIQEAPGVDLNARVQGEHGMTPLMFAVRGEGMLEVTKALVAKGAQLEVKDSKNFTAIMHAMGALLEEAGAAWDGLGYDLVSNGARLGVARVVQALVRRMRADGKDEATVAGVLSSAVSDAIEKADVAMLKVVVGAGADVKSVEFRVKTEHGKLVKTTALHAACQSGSQEVVEYLIAQGCDPLEADELGFLPHHGAAGCGKLPLLQWLLSRYSIPLDTAGHCGGTALHFAALQGRFDTVEWLIEAGADLKATRLCPDGKRRRASELAFDLGGHQTVAMRLVMAEMGLKGKAAWDFICPPEQRVDTSLDAATAAARAAAEEEDEDEEAGGDGGPGFGLGEILALLQKAGLNVQGKTEEG
jgi:ankyrin repeat protein